MMEFFGTFCLSAKKSPHLNVGFKHLGVASHLSVNLTLPEIIIISYEADLALYINAS